MISIKKEIDEHAFTDHNSPLKNAPHTQGMLTADEWNFPYTRQKAAFPLEHIKENKFWPFVRRVNEAHGDRNLVCSCLPIEEYM
jgi:glycine dehydrogenase